MTHTDEHELLARCRDGDEMAMQVLYNQHHRKVYAMALRLTGSESDAEDVVQDTFLKAFKYIGKFRGDSAVSTWLCRIAINLSRDAYKKKSRTRPEADLELTDSREPRDGLARKHLEAALAQLPEGYREVLVMHDVMDMGHAEIAGILDIQEGTSKSQLHKARARMRELLAGQGRGS